MRSDFGLLYCWVDPKKELPLCFHTHSFKLEKEEKGKSDTMVDKEKEGK